MRLINYKSRWYLQAWCHRTDAVKTFSLEYIRDAEVIAKHCKDVSLKSAEAMDATFGIFAGDDVKKAAIHFDAAMSPYVKAEVWHRDQILVLEDDGTVTLEVPYANETELLGQILSYGEHAEVTAPTALREAMKKRLAATVAVYAKEAA